MGYINGELLRAQLENLASDPAQGITARIWNNTTSGQVKSDDGTDIRAFLKNDQKNIIGNSGTAAENVRWNRSGVGTLQLVLGDNTTVEATGSTFVAQLGFRTENYTDAGKPGTGNAGRMIWNTTFNALNVDTGSAWASVGSGGGVGAFLDFYPKPGDGPLEGEAGNLKFWEFADESTETLIGLLKVPNGYQAGQQITLAVTVESDEAGSQTLNMQCVSTLIREGTDPMTDVTNQETDTDTYSPAAVFAKELTFAVSDASGDINGVAVTAGDLIKLELTKPTDLSTENIRMFQSLVEIRTG